MKKIKKIRFISIIFIGYFILGLFLYKDYGVGIEEHFQRQNGFFWLKNIAEKFELRFLADAASSIFFAIRSYDPSLPNPEFFNFYGIIFDVPLALVEIILQDKEIKFFFELRHLINFFIFFISSIYFFKILKKRFNSDIIIFWGVTFYVCSPRIFGDSFHNNKDVLFLAFLTISFYYLFNLFEKNKLKDLILFSIFAAIATSTRIMGIYLPLLYFIFLFFEFINQNINLKFFLKKIFFVLFFYILFLYLHYPYMWDLRLDNIFNWFSKFFYNMNLRILFNGEYFHIKYLPRLYLPVWIFITTPVYILILSFVGFYLLAKRAYRRILSIQFKKKNHFNDLWRSNNEKKDFFIFISLTVFLLYAISFDVAMLSGWRHFYFLNLYIVYIAIYCLNIIFLFVKKNEIKKNSFIFVNFILVLNIITQIYNFHPYQSLYFNELLVKKNILKFPVDTPSLSRKDALKFIIADAINLDKINIANASWTPLYNGKDLLLEKNYKKLNFVGQDYDKADYIYTNFVYEINPNFNNKYFINENFKTIKEHKIKDITIYKIYKKLN